MTDFFVNAHSGWQYVVLLALVVALYFAFARPTLNPTSSRAYSIAAIAVDIQVTLGIVVWILQSGWSLGFVQGWLHPIVGLAALGVLHAFLGRARKGHPENAGRTVKVGFGIALALVVAAIAIAEVA